MRLEHGIVTLRPFRKIWQTDSLTNWTTNRQANQNRQTTRHPTIWRTWGVIGKFHFLLGIIGKKSYQRKGKIHDLFALKRWDYVLPHRPPPSILIVSWLNQGEHIAVSASLFIPQFIYLFCRLKYKKASAHISSLGGALIL